MGFSVDAVRREDKDGGRKRLGWFLGHRRRHRAFPRPLPGTVVGLTHDVAETYVPVRITVAYAAQKPVPKPFLMILEWIRTPAGWKMATDITLPIPPAPPSN